MAEKLKKNQVKLSDERVISFNMFAISWDEAFSVNGLRGNEEGYKEIMGKVTGLSADEIGTLPYPDVKQIDKLFSELLRDPTGSDPN